VPEQPRDEQPVASFVTVVSGDGAVCSASVASYAAWDVRDREAPAFRGRRRKSAADTKHATPATARPLYKFPVLRLIMPTAYGPAKPPRFATDVINAMPDAAANPARNSLGDAKYGPKKL
jgi:hypothetical protein